MKFINKIFGRKQAVSKIAHVVNPFRCSEDNPSYLYYAQPITFRSMFVAQDEAKKAGISVALHAAVFPQDAVVVPEYFNVLPHLQTSTRTRYPDISDRELPFIEEILGLLKSNSDAPFLVFTNSDIGLMPSFYIAASKYISEGYDAFVINRRDNFPKFLNGRRLTVDDMDIIYQQKGVSHYGFDCFIFHRKYLDKLRILEMFLGYPPWGRLMVGELERNAKKFKVFRDLHETFHIGNDETWKTQKAHKLWDQNILNARNNGYHFEGA